MELNPIQDMLERCGVPWRESQDSLRTRAEPMPDPTGGFEEVVPVAGTPVAGLIHPLHFSWDPTDNLAMPPLLLSGHIHAADGLGSWLRGRAMSSLAAGQASLEAQLGPGERFDSDNMRGWQWVAGPSSVELVCYPASLNREYLSDVAWSDPRLAEAAWLRIQTGFRLSLSAREEALVRGFEAAFELGDQREHADIIAEPPQQSLLDYVREPIAGVDRLAGAIGRSPDRETILFATDQLYLIPAADIRALRVERVKPARGGGYAALYLVCRSGNDPDMTRDIRLADHDDADGFNELSGKLARWLGRPCELEPYDANY